MVNNCKKNQSIEQNNVDVGYAWCYPETKVTIQERIIIMKKTWTVIHVTAGILLFLTACTHKVQVEAPEKPITINLNVKIEHEIKVKVDKELDTVFSKESGLF